MPIFSFAKCNVCGCGSSSSGQGGGIITGCCCPHTSFGPCFPIPEHTTGTLTGLSGGCPNLSFPVDFAGLSATGVCDTIIGGGASLPPFWSSPTDPPMRYGNASLIVTYICCCNSDASICGWYLTSFDAGTTVPVLADVAICNPFFLRWNSLNLVESCMGSAMLTITG